MVVPPIGFDSTEMLPFTKRTRSRMLVRPRPCCRAQIASAPTLWLGVPLEKIRRRGAVCLRVLLDRAGRICSPDGCDAERPDLVGRLLFRGSARRTGFAFPFFDVMTVRARLLGEFHQSSFMVMGGARVVRYHVSSWMQRKNTRTSPSSHVISSPKSWFGRHEPSQADGVVMVHLPRLKKWNR
jgi:hypothetical protein